MYELTRSDYKAVLDLVTSLVNVKSISAFSEMLVNAKYLLGFDNVTLSEVVFDKNCTINLVFTDNEYLKDINSLTVSNPEVGESRVLQEMLNGQEVIKSESLSYFNKALGKIVSLPEDYDDRRYHILCRLNKETMTADVISFVNISQKCSEKFDAISGYLHTHLMSTFVRIMSVREGETEKLSEREESVLTWLKHGKTSWEVAKILDITENTVNFHIKNIKRKLNATNRQHAVAIAIAKGIVK